MNQPRIYMYLCNDTTVSLFPYECANTKLFSKAKVPGLLWSTKITVGIGPNSISPLLRFHSHTHLSVLNKSLRAHFIAVCWTSVTIVLIPKPSNPVFRAKSFRPTVLTSYGLWTNRTCHPETSNFCQYAWWLLQLAHNPNRFTSNALDSLVHNMAKSLDASAKSVWGNFLDFPCAFDSIPPCLLLPKLEQFVSVDQTTSPTELST